MERRIVSVSQLNAYIKNTLDSDFLLQNIWIQGEISNFKLHYSGHMYLSLKDSEGVLRAVMFKGAGASLKFMPENGMQVLARGRISVFPRDGAYQLYIEEMEPAGAGALYLAFEQLKKKLEAEGLCSQERKKALPRFPDCVGVITSATGAALRDILNILERRWPMTRVVIYPVLVQGEGAAGEIANAIAVMNAKQVADVLIVGRGGGSQEDLWAFNEEIVARAVANSRIPVISAVGHETDFTICDFVADFRAPTPSAAAEIAVPDVQEIREKLVAYEKRLVTVLSLHTSQKREKLQNLMNRLCGFGRRIEDLQYAVDQYTTNIVNGMTAKLEKENQNLSQLALTMDALSPLKVLTRGYAIAAKNGTPLNSVALLSPDDEIDITLADGKANCKVIGVERKEQS